MSRSWCFQERVLARRTVHFTQHQMYWECEQGLFWERIDKGKSTNVYEEYSIRRIGVGLTRSLLRTVTDADKAWYDRKPWFDAVREYTSRNITYESDKLPALSGIAAALQRITGDVYYAGLWRSWFVQGLLWRFQDSTIDVYIQVPKQTKNISVWRAPTWSFAALEGVVDYVHQDASAGTCATLEECVVVPKGSNPLGELGAGFAIINGPLTSVTDIEMSTAINGRECKLWRRDRRSQRATIRFDLDYREFCDALMITPYVGLALAPVRDKPQTYIRVGIITAYQDDRERDHNGMVVFGAPLTAVDWPAPVTVVLL
ncbi:hypothetical protein E8E12_007491 [Didymella heteroderae]|uniref:Heterokaryon incompatibility domain-containing protein n=1 Tax=Didymella heteroderae TaxID=1769908 RepID=A0A9P4WQY6_9PLEO|nr:hypothetical protein E8E12_007491 [Didymella heteroderae]